MAVRGIGIDVIQVERLVRSLERFGRRMEARLFTDGELEYCRGHKDPIPHLAARFAAKEAASKAIGTGMSGGIGFRQFEVHQPGGRVTMTREPQSPMVPVHWRAGDLERLLKRLGEEVALEAGGDRRTLRLANPGLPFGTTPTF